MERSSYDYAIIGAGGAGLKLALAFVEDDFFKDKTIVLLDADPKDKNDKTWCFWEKGNGKWDAIVNHQWKHGLFASEQGQIPLSLEPYSYKQMRSIDFYNHAKLVIANSSRVTWIRENVSETIETNEGLEVITSNHRLKVNHCFDSRIPVAFSSVEDDHIRILQHFKGWKIKFVKPVFNPSHFTMMDFRLRDGDTTSFSYVLPESDREALVEFTYFTEHLVADETYDYYLKKYIQTYISKEHFVIEEVEKGVIPMTTFPFHNFNSENITKIGTAGGWVRPSTGYSFGMIDTYVDKILENIKNGRSVSSNLMIKKSMFYDRLLLDIMKKHNGSIPAIFHQLYSKNPLGRMFRFLDGTSTIMEDIKVISTPPKMPFIKALKEQYLF